MSVHRPRVREGGFTLVEMMVALSIFALLASSGVALMRSAVDGQASVKAHDTARLTADQTSELARSLPLLHP